MANFVGFDPVSAADDVDRLIDMIDQAKEGTAPIKAEKSRLKAERGYNMKGVAMGIVIRRADIREAHDIVQTLVAVLEGINVLQPGTAKLVPDLVDMAEEMA